MPIIGPSPPAPPVFFPAGNYTVAKYIDILRFISLLQRQALFFCRFDKLEDKFEGTTAKANYQLRRQWYTQTEATPMTDEQINSKLLQHYEFERKKKALNCVCCWNKHQMESAALWKIYADFNKGIMIKSSIERLKKALNNSKEEIQLTEVNYIDYSNDLMLDGNSNYPLLHKHSAYDYEEEIRLIHAVSSDNNWNHDWTIEEVEEGIYINVDLDVLIDEIVMAPDAPRWFEKLLIDLLSKYGINKKVKQSQLTFA